MQSGSTPTPTARFPKEARIRRRRDFLTIQRKGRRRHTDHFIAASVERRDEAGARLGVTVSREVGNAVVRNHVKRRLREFFRRNRPATSIDLVVIAKRGAGELTYGRISEELAGILRT